MPVQVSRYAGEMVELETTGHFSGIPWREYVNAILGVRAEGRKKRGPKTESYRTASFEGMKENKVAKKFLRNCRKRVFQMTGAGHRHGNLESWE